MSMENDSTQYLKYIFPSETIWGNNKGNILTMHPDNNKN